MGELRTYLKNMDFWGLADNRLQKFLFGRNSKMVEFIDADQIRVFRKANQGIYGDLSNCEVEILNRFEPF